MAGSMMSPQQAQMMVAYMQNPQQGLQLQQQQALAQQMMQQGSQQADPNETINEGIGGARVVPFNKFGGLARAAEQIAGAYQQKGINQQLGAMMQGVNNDASSGQTVSPNGSPSPQALGATMNPKERLDQMAYGTGTEEFKQRMAVQNAGPEEKAKQAETWFKMPDGTYRQGSQMGGNPPSPPMPAQTSSNTMVGANANMAPLDKANATLDVLNGNDMPAKPVNLQGANDQPMQVPMAADGKPYIDTPKTYAPDPTGTAKFNFENTDTGVADAKDKAAMLNKDNAAFAQGVSGFKNEGNQIDNLASIYKQTQGGTLIAQNPEIANKLVAMGIISDPKEISNVANVQAAMNSHILDTLRQLRDANTNVGGPTSRMMAGEINAMLEEGASAKDQPEAMYKILSNAKGLVDYNMDMAKGWDSMGGTGNRMANGYTMPLSDYTNKFAFNHDMQDYKDNAAKAIGPLKGMLGNQPPGAVDILHLQQNPQKAAMFDKAFGAGASQKYLNQPQGMQ